MMGDFYTVSEAARVLGVTQRRLLEMLAAEELEGERDPQSGRWKLPKHALHGLAPKSSPTSQSSGDNTGETSEPSDETTQEILGELDNLQMEIGRLKKRLELARQTENTAWQEERELLLAELEQEREERRQDRMQAESILQTERDRLLEDLSQERERVADLQEEANKLQEDLETERSKGPWRKLFGR